MYVTNSDGNVVKFQYYHDDSDEELSPVKTFAYSNVQSLPRIQTPIKQIIQTKTTNLNKSSIMQQKTEEEHKLPSINQNITRTKHQTKNLMGNSLIKNFEQGQITTILQDLIKQQSLQSLLHNVKPEFLSNEEVVLLFIWTRPLVTNVKQNDEYSIYARGILGVDVIQSQGLLRNCETLENNLINIVESYFKLQRSMDDYEYDQLLRKAVYSAEKSQEVKSKLQILGDNWFNFKEQLKSLKLHEAPNIANPKLMKQTVKNKQFTNLTQNKQSFQDVEILIKLIPYFDINISESKRVKPEANQLRKLLAIGKSEAQMIIRRKKLYTLFGIINTYFDMLVQNEMTEQLEQEFHLCFYNNTQKTKIFVSTLQRIVWEYNYVNKLFVEHYRKLRNLNDPNNYMQLPETRDILIFGGFYPFTLSQINSIAQIVNKNKAIKSLSLNFARIRNQGLQQLVDTLKSNRWKSIRIFDDNLFSLDLTNNFIDQDGIQALLELFFDNFDVKVGLKYEAPIPTSIRILILDYNFLGKKQLKVLSLNRTRLIGKDLKKFCTALAQNPNLKALNMGQNKVGNVGMNFLAEALKINQGLQFLDLFDCDFEDDGAFSLAECILQNKHLINLRIANTRVTQQASQPLLKTLLTDQMVRDNLPELSREERILLQMETMDISKDLANNYLVDHKKQEFGSKKQSIQLYDQYGSSSKMSEFYPQSCFTKHLGKELLFTLVTFELNINFMNHEGFTPLIMAIKFKQKSLQQILLSGYIPQLDMNIKCENLQYKSQTALHIAVIQNDYDALKMLLEYQGNIKPDISIKDMNGKSPIDLAYMYNYPKMHQLLEQHTLRLQAVINEDLLKQNIILKKKEEEENKNYLDVEIDMFKRLLLQNQSSVYQ
eukprot:403350327